MCGILVIINKDLQPLNLQKCIIQLSPDQFF